MLRFNRCFPVAWFQAEASAQVTAKANQGYSITASETTVSLSAAEIKLTVSKDTTIANNVQLSHVHVTNDSSDPLKDKVTYGAMTNGVELVETEWSGTNTGDGAITLIGQYKVTGQITTSPLSTGTKAALKGNSYTFALATTGNAVILDANPLTNSNADAKNVASAPTVTVTFNSIYSPPWAVNERLPMPRSCIIAGMESEGDTANLIHWFYPTALTGYSPFFLFA